MTEPLDFTKEGREKAALRPSTARRPAQAPPPVQAPPRQRKPRSLDQWWKNKSVLVLVVVIVAVVIGVVLVVRSRHSTSSSATAAKVSRNCQLNIQFDSVALSTGASSSSGAFDGPPAAMAELVKQTKPTLSEMESVAPGSISSDVSSVVSAVEKAAKGDRSGVGAPSFAAARHRIQMYELANCGTGGGSGEG